MIEQVPIKDRDTKGDLYESGYGAFSVSQSDACAVIAYIRNQAQHHQKMTFQDEYRRLLERYQVAFDEKPSSTAPSAGSCKDRVANRSANLEMNWK